MCARNDAVAYKSVLSAHCLSKNSVKGVSANVAVAVARAALHADIAYLVVDKSFQHLFAVAASSAVDLLECSLAGFLCLCSRFKYSFFNFKALLNNGLGVKNFSHQNFPFMCYLSL